MGLAQGFKHISPNPPCNCRAFCAVLGFNLRCNPYEEKLMLYHLRKDQYFWHFVGFSLAPSPFECGRNLTPPYSSSTDVKYPNKSYFKSGNCINYVFGAIFLFQTFHSGCCRDSTLNTYSLHFELNKYCNLQNMSTNGKICGTYFQSDNRFLA